MNKARKNVLYAVTVILTLLAAATLVPNPGASWPNLLGYRSVCTFAPVSTLILCWATAVVCTYRSRSGKAGACGLPVPLLALSVPFLAGIVYFSVRYVAIVSVADAVSRASR